MFPTRYSFLTYFNIQLYLGESAYASTDFFNGLRSHVNKDDRRAFNHPAIGDDGFEKGATCFFIDHDSCRQSRFVPLSSFDTHGLENIVKFRFPVVPTSAMHIIHGPVLTPWSDARIVKFYGNKRPLPGGELWWTETLKESLFKLPATKKKPAPASKKEPTKKKSTTKMSTASSSATAAFQPPTRKKPAAKKMVAKKKNKKKEDNWDSDKSEEESIVSSSEEEEDTVDDFVTVKPKSRRRDEDDKKPPAKRARR